MIDRLRQIADAMRFLRIPAILAASICLVSIVALLLTSTSHAGDRLLMPSFVGVLWATSLWSFIEIFSAVPGRPITGHGLYARLGRSMRRAWFWVLAILLACAIGAALLLTTRLASIWLSEYGV
jgi:hypothetical protein